MKLLRTTALSAALMTAAVPSLTTPANAWGWRGGWGWGGVGLGLAAGALIGSAIAASSYGYYGYGYPYYGYGYGYPAYGYGYPAYGYGYASPSYYYGGYGGYYRPYYGAYYGSYYGYRIARRSSSIMLAGAKKHSATTLAGAKIRRVNSGALLASSTPTSPRAHPPKRIQGRFVSVAAR